MNIIWHGFSCFSIDEKLSQGDVRIVIDPFAPSFGKKLPRNLSADLLLSSNDHPRHRYTEGVGDNPFLITGPGEFEVKDVFVTGIPSHQEASEGKEKTNNTMFFLTIGNIHILHCGDLGGVIEGKVMDDFHDIDILFLPVGGGDSLSGKQAAELAQMLEPRIIVPMNYKTEGVGDGLDSADAFLKALGVSKPERIAKLKVTEKDLPQDEMRVIMLETQ